MINRCFFTNIIDVSIRILYNSGRSTTSEPTCAKTLCLSTRRLCFQLKKLWLLHHHSFSCWILGLHLLDSISSIIDKWENLFTAFQYIDQRTLLLYSGAISRFHLSYKPYIIDIAYKSLSVDKYVFPNLIEYPQWILSHSIPWESLLSDQVLLDECIC